MRLLLVALTSAVAPALAGNPLPTFTASVDVDTIGTGTVAELRVDIGVAAPTTGLGFGLTLPADVDFVGPASTTCDGALEVSGDTLTLSDARSSAACAVLVHVTSDVAASYALTTTDLSSSAGTVSAASASLVVAPAPVDWSASFVPSRMPLGDAAAFAVQLEAGGGVREDVGFDLLLPAGLEVDGGLTTDCFGNDGTDDVLASITEANGRVLFTAADLDLTSGCTASVDLRGVAADAITAITTPLSDSTGILTGGVASTVDVYADPLRAVITDDPVVPGSSATLQLALTNFDRSQDAADVAFTLDLDALLTGTVVGALPTEPCGAGSAVSGTSVLDVSGIDLPAGSDCVFEVPLTIPTGVGAGVYTATTSVPSLILGGSAATWPAADVRLVVDTAPSLAFAVDPANAGPGDTVDMTLTLTNTDGAQALSDGAFTQTLAGLGSLDTATLPADDFCGTGSSMSFTAASTEPAVLAGSGLALASGDSCTFTVTLTLPQDVGSGTAVLDADVVSATVGGSAVAGVTVPAELALVGVPQLTVALDPDTVLAGDTVTAAITVVLGEHTDPFTDLGFTLDLDAALTGLTATALPADGSCGASSTFTGTSTLTVAGASLGQSGGGSGDSCTFELTLQLPAGADAGEYTLTTSTFAATQGSETFASAPASATLTVAEVTVDLVFSPSTVQAGDTFTATWTVSNLRDEEATVLAMFERVFDSFPGATASNMSTCANSAFVDSAGALIFSASTLPALSQCVFSADLTLPVDFEPGDVTHRTNELTGTFATSTFAATGTEATLSVVEPLDWRGSVLRETHSTQTAPVEITITNSTTSAATDLAFTLDLDAVAAGLVAEGLPTADACGTGSSLSGTSTVALTDGTLASGASCTLAFDVRVPATVVGAVTLDLVTSELTGTIDSITESASSLSIPLNVLQPCRDGYGPEDDGCVDIDECADGVDDCDPVASCTNSVGSYSCACPSGYDGDGSTCTDVDECTDGLDDCATDAVCTNTGGSFSCACDPGFDGDGTTCDPVCGDGLIVGDEECDDEGTATGDGCDANCLVEDGWACVDEPSVCAETCGDGALDDGEACDDGNLDPGDGCDATCQIEAGWACEGEPSDCAETCGNGVLDAGEQCDDGNLTGDDGCDATCEVEDGYVCADDGTCERDGCGCRAAGPGSVGWLVFALPLMARRRR